MEAPTIHHNCAAERFEASVGGQLARVDYVLEGDTITFTHTIVPPSLQGRGIGTELARAALEDARSRGLKVVPMCSFIAQYIEAHPETRDLLATIRDGR